MQKLALAVLRLVLRPSRGFLIAASIVVFLFMTILTQYRMKGRVDVGAMINRGSEMGPFWQRNPRLQFLDSFPNTSFVMVKDTQTGRSAMLDSAVVINAEVRPVECSASVPAMLPPGAGSLVCFEIAKPDTGAGDVYTGAVSFQLNGKDTQVSQFYRALFESRQDNVTVIKDSSNGIILEAADTRGNTVERISIRSSFQMVTAFLAWTRELQRRDAPR